MQRTDLGLALAYGLDPVRWAKMFWIWIPIPGLRMDRRDRAVFCARPARVHGVEMPAEGADHTPG
jgi:hypothetical protein